MSNNEVISSSENESNISNDNSMENDDNVMKLLIASDINLGYEETIQRKQFDDSFITFEEILQHAVKNDVDCILLAGNLFHSAKPSQTTMTKCINLLRTYCLGSRNLKIQLLADPSETLHNKDISVNFEDPNFNINIPIFCIHGADDESLHGDAGPLDILSIIGVLNYFGVASDSEIVQVNPLLMKKGETILALHGLGYIHEQKIVQIFAEEKIGFQNVNYTEGLEKAFNLLMISEPRDSAGKCLKDDAFPNFFDLIIWGYEHECSIEPKKVPGKKYSISQPGSTIATTLTAREAVPKSIGILNINKTQMNMQKIQLRTVRPFIHKEIILKDYDNQIKRRFPRSEQVFNFLAEFIESEIIPMAEEQLTGHKYQPKLPLVKLKIIYENEKDVCDTIGLCRMFCDQTANAMEMVMWKKARNKKTNRFDEEEDDAWTRTQDEKKWYMSIQDRLQDYFSKEKNREKLHVMSIEGFNNALSQFIEKEDSSAFEAVLNFQIDKCIEYVTSANIENNVSENSLCILEKVTEFCTSVLENETETAKEIRKMLESKSRSKYERSAADTNQASTRLLNLNTDEVNIPSTSRGKSSTRGRKAQSESNKNNLNVTITSGKKPRGKSTASKTFFKPSHSVFKIPDVFDSQNSVDPLNMEDYHCGDW